MWRASDAFELLADGGTRSIVHANSVRGAECDTVLNGGHGIFKVDRNRSSQRVMRRIIAPVGISVSEFFDHTPAAT